MMRPSVEREPNPGILERALFGSRLAMLKRFLRWFNLTMLQQALWPLAILLFSAPQVALDATPWTWFGLRIAGPIAAAVVAALYCSQFWSSRLHMPGRASDAPQRKLPRSAIATQLRYVMVGLPLAVGAMRLATGPVDEASKIILFGLANVAAFHLINFGLVPLAYSDRRHGLQAGVLLFGLSWGLHDALRVALGDESGVLLAFAAGAFLGLIVGAMSLLVRRWPGGALTAASAHVLVIYLIFGFV
ncbi:hypothetical protein BH23CHL5_BH23CHL5_07270 [soil metagenome]